MSRHKHFHLVLATAALATTVVVAACGGSSSPSPTTHTTVPNGSAKSAGGPAFRYSTCMRAHGVSNFPDPKVEQNGQQVSVIIHMTPAIANSPAFQSAQGICKKYLPVGNAAPALTAAAVQKQRAAGLAFARCMRDHGFSKFPDPTAQGQLNPEMVTAAGINLHQPALLHAGLACVSVTHGMLTAADIERAVSGQENGG